MSPDWKNLPGHLLDSIVGKFESPSDFFGFSLVCKSWYSVAKHNESKVSRTTTPMLLICANKSRTWNVYNIREKKLLNFQVSLPNKRCCGSSKGWLITIENDFRMTLINPFQRLKGRRKKENSIIRLPPLPYRSQKDHKSNWSDNPIYVYKCTLSADPVLNANDCVLIVTYGEFRLMSFIRVGKDATWTCIDDRWRGIVDLAYFEGRFYALDQAYKILSFEITTQAIPDIQLFHQDIGPKPCLKYLLISNDKELVMIYRIYKYNITRGGGVIGKRVTTGFKIFEFNFDKREWKKKNTLDDAVVFLGDNSAISVPVSGSSGCEPNCIYFCHDIDYDGGFCGTDFGGYNLMTQSFFEPFTKEATTLAKKSAWPTIWVTPNFQL